MGRFSWASDSGPYTDSDDRSFHGDTCSYPEGNDKDEEREVRQTATSALKGIPRYRFCNEIPVVNRWPIGEHTGRRYYGCRKAEDGGCAMRKFVDEAVVEEIHQLKTEAEWLETMFHDKNSLYPVKNDVLRLREQVKLIQTDLACAKQSLDEVCKKTVAANKKAYWYGYSKFRGVFALVLALCVVVMTLSWRYKT